MSKNYVKHHVILKTIFWGKVKKNKGRGKELGFPTANINLRKRISEGVYISQTKVNKIIYPSVTFIGTAKTFNEKNYQAESYILSFSNNIYGRWISIKLLKKLRENKKFSKVSDLVKQIKKDVEAAKLFFRNFLSNSY